MYLMLEQVPVIPSTSAAVNNHSPTSFTFISVLRLMREKKKTTQLAMFQTNLQRFQLYLGLTVYKTSTPETPSKNADVSKCLCSIQPASLCVNCVQDHFLVRVH